MILRRSRLLSPRDSQNVPDADVLVLPALWVITAFWATVRTMAAPAASAVAFLLGVVCWLVSAGAAFAVDEAEAASGPPLHVAIFANARPFRCYSDGRLAALERLTRLATEEINGRGGVRGRPVEAVIYDNGNNDRTAVANARAALALDDLVGMIGLTNPTRAGKVFEAVAADPRGKGIPFISNISVGGVLAGHPNVFSTRPAQEVERVPAMVEFFKASGIDTIAFLGRTKRTYVDVIGQGLADAMGSRLLSDQRIDVAGSRGEARLDAAALERSIAAIEANPPAMLVVAVGTRFTKAVLERLKTAEVQYDILNRGMIIVLISDW